MSRKIEDGLTSWKRSAKKRHDNAPMVECLCKCGEEIKSIDKHGKERKYVKGHHMRTQPKNLIDLKKAEFAYFYGFIQADGSFNFEGNEKKDKGRLTIELKADDYPLLKKFHEIIPYNSSLSKRERGTNFKDGYKTASLRISNQGFRHELLALGMKYGKKSNTAEIPIVPFSEIDFFRGLIDGDGSIGTTKNGNPFLSLTTSSNSLKEAYIAFLKSITGKNKEINRNARDGVYNIVIYSEDAQKVASVLYYPNCIALERKREKFKKVMCWKRPEGIRKTHDRKNWNTEQDNYILNHEIEDSMKHLKRSESSIKTRLYRLKN